MPTLHEWLDGKTKAGVALDPLKVAAYCRNHGTRLPSHIHQIPQSVPAVVRPHPESVAGGVGTELKKLLALAEWVTQSYGCQTCIDRAREMDSRGITWCEENVETIVGWLMESAAAMKVVGVPLNIVPGPVMRTAIRPTVMKAIANAKSNSPRERRARRVPEPIDKLPRTITTRHFMCHLWPVSGYGAWQWNCDKILENAHLFNGRRVVAITESKESDHANAVREYLKDFTDEFIVVRNDSRLREVVTWVPMLERLQSYNGPGDVTFACHGKCVRHKIALGDEGTTIFRWTNVMYETCLNWPRVETALETNAMAGSFRRRMKTGALWGPWHYSGTFFWFRNSDVFSRDWRYVPQFFAGTESWPGLLFREEDTACLVGDGIEDLYKLDYWNKTIEPLLAEWRQRED